PSSFQTGPTLGASPQSYAHPIGGLSGLSTRRKSPAFVPGSLLTNTFAAIHSTSAPVLSSATFLSTPPLGGLYYRCIAPSVSISVASSSPPSSSPSNCHLFLYLSIYLSSLQSTLGRFHASGSVPDVARLT